MKTEAGLHVELYGSTEREHFSLRESHLNPFVGAGEFMMCH